MITWRDSGGPSSTGRRFVLLAAVALLTVVLGVVASAAWMAGQRESAGSAADEAARCQALADRIEALRHEAGGAGESSAASPGRTGGASRPVDVVRVISGAAADAGIDDRDLDRIEPEAPRRAAGPGGRAGDGEALPGGAGPGAPGSGAMEQPTQVAIRRATLEQLVRFLHALASPPAGLRVLHLRLTVPADGAAGGGDADAAAAPWAAEATLVGPVSAAGDVPAPAADVPVAPRQPPPPAAGKLAPRYEHR